MKKGLEASFAWIFAIIVGAFILFVAIYAASQVISSGRLQTDTEVAAQVSALLSPVETTIESGKYSKLQFTQETRLTNRCLSTGAFGKQEISTQVKSGIGSTWAKESLPIITENKYLFSEKTEQGTTLHLFTKPFEAGFKVGDLIIATTKDYCFVNPPQFIEDDLRSSALPFVNISTSEGRCLPGSIKVCFTQSSSCDVKVDIVRVSVTKKGKTVYYGDQEELGLMYASILSDPDIYECQIKRLMKRASQLSELYVLKSDFLHGSGCSGDLGSELRAYGQFTGTLSNSGSLGTVFDEATKLEDANEALSCKLF